MKNLDPEAAMREVTSGALPDSLEHNAAVHGEAWRRLSSVGSSPAVPVTGTTDGDPLNWAGGRRETSPAFVPSAPFDRNAVTPVANANEQLSGVEAIVGFQTGGRK